MNSDRGFLFLRTLQSGTSLKKLRSHPSTREGMRDPVNCRSLSRQLLVCYHPPETRFGATESSRGKRVGHPPAKAGLPSIIGQPKSNFFMKQMSTKREFLRDLLAMIDRATLALGFERRNRSYAFDLNVEALGVVNYDVTTHRLDGRIGVNPIVGIHFRPVEARVREWFQKGPYLTPTVSTSLGYVTPEKRFLEWLFELEFENEQEVSKMVRAIADYGMPFMKSHQTLESMTEALEHKNFTVNESRAYRLPVAYLLQGKKENAVQILNQEISKLGTRTDEAARNYRAFETRLLENPQ